MVLTLCRCLWSVVDHCRLLVAGCESLWIVVCSGSLRAVPRFSTYALKYKK